MDPDALVLKMESQKVRKGRMKVNMAVVHLVTLGCNHDVSLVQDKNSYLVEVEEFELEAPVEHLQEVKSSKGQPGDEETASHLARSADDDVVSYLGSSLDFLPSHGVTHR